MRSVTRVLSEAMSDPLPRLADRLGDVCYAARGPARGHAWGSTLKRISVPADTLTFHTSVHAKAAVPARSPEGHAGASAAPRKQC